MGEVGDNRNKEFLDDEDNFKELLVFKADVECARHYFTISGL